MKWLFNSYMIWGAALGALILLSANHFRETARHRGPGWVEHGDGERSPEWSEKVSEQQFKRHHFATSGLCLAVGVGLWIVLARSARNETAKAKAKEEYLEAQLRSATAYQRAVFSTLDESLLTHAIAQAQASPEYQGALAEEKNASRALMIAVKNSKPETT